MSEQKITLTEQFTRMSAMIHRLQLQRFRSFGPFGIPQRGQGRVLSILKLKPEINQTELAYMLGVSKQSLGELLGKLEKGGYVTREPSEQDRRSVIVKLTAEGEAESARMEESREAPADKFFDILTEEEQTVLGGYLTRLLEKLDSELGIPDEETQQKRFAEARERYEKPPRDPRDPHAPPNWIPPWHFPHPRDFER
ncbi:MAG: MarR family transcriptional regulator [Oscillospiraceae bacterium]|jgi:DNA-binding MarR family transcriptional regulator|nr:MarR family transcriptional regulator [Oscillospiraceae bacterium]